MMEKHEHIWESSTSLLGLVGTLYPSLYPCACKCGAIKKADGEIIEPKEKAAE